MNYNDFRFEAVVDRLRVEITTTEPLHYRSFRLALRRALENMRFDPDAKPPFVERIDPQGNIIEDDQNTPATVFRLWVQGPRTFAEVKRTLEELDAELSNQSRVTSFAKLPELLAVEVALDARSNTGSRADMTEMTARMFRYWRIPHRENKRVYRTGGKFDKTFSPVALELESVQRYVDQGWQLGIGNRADDTYWHLYIKDSDNGKKLELCDDNGELQHRARAEVTLQGAALPFKTLEELQQADFRKLFQTYFRFAKVKDEAELATMNKIAVHAAMQSDQIGMASRSVRRRNGGGKRKSSPIAKADRELSDIARDELRKLSGRWKR